MSDSGAYPILTIDKSEHATVGAACSRIVEHETPTVRLIIPVLVAVGKEALDETGRGTPDPWDAVATAAGALCAYRSERLEIVPTIGDDVVALDLRLRF